VLCGFGFYFRHFAAPHEREAMLAMRGMYITACLCLALLLCAFTTLFTAATVAGEREQNTLDFLLLLPVERWEILLTKAAAPWAANRLTVAMLLAYPLIGVMFGLLPLSTGLALLVLPWPTLLFASALALLLSVVCRRVRHVHISMGIILALIFLAHVICYRQLGLILLGIGHVLGLEPPKDLHLSSRDEAVLTLAIHQVLVLLAAAGCVGLAFWIFKRRS
jgi:ABC-type transport system involved in multi-copper enzyme maturation permease subunit